MNADLQELEKQVLALPARKRAELVDKLWESLGDTTSAVINEKWLAEIERRRQHLLKGKGTSVPGEEVSRKAWEIANRTRS
jgi:putative addiction module component (TIGR02574 family)